MAALEGRDGTRVAQAATGVTAMGFRANEGGGGALNTGWTTGNLGNTWDEGEWVPYQFVLVDVQDNFPNLNGLNIGISYDFFASQGGQNARFVDLVRDIQVCPTARNDSQGWVNSSGTAFPHNTRTNIEIAQNSEGEFAWSDCMLLNLPNDQVHRATDGTIGTPTTPLRAFFIHKDDVLPASFIDETTDSFVIYFQLHLSRTFIWENSLQSAYDAPPTDDWGGYLYGDPPFSTDSRRGSGFLPGSSGHASLFTISGTKTVPIPIPPAPVGQICGLKWRDADFDGVKDPSETTLSGWDIWARVVVESIEVSFKETTAGDGTYCFDRLTPGFWTVSEDIQSGWLQTYPADGTQLGTPTTVCTGDDAFDAGDNPDPGPVAWECILPAALQGNVNFGNAQPDARISINPPTGVNEVGTDHDLTCTIEVLIDGTGFQPAPDDTVCNVSIVSGPGQLSASSCNTSGGTGQCTVTLTTTGTGQTVIHAETDVNAGGVTLHRETDGTGSNSEDAEKFWVDASVSIAPSDTNEVNQSHVFTITVTISKSAAVTVDYVDITPTGDASFITADTCVDDQSSTATSCTVTVNSAAAGSATIGADVEVKFSHDSGSATVNRSTDGSTTTSGLTNSGPATKTWVNAKISISPATATNAVGTTHDLTCTIEINDGSGWTNAPNGTVCDADISGVGGFVSGDDDCTVDGGDGNCILTITSSVVGTSTVVACTAEDNTGGVVVGGVTLFRCTDGQSVESGSSNSGSASKTWVDAKISITPDATNFIHTTHNFTCEIQIDNGSGWVPAVGVTCTGTILSGPGSFVSGDNDCVTNSGGQCTLTITSTTTGVTVVKASANVPVNGDTIAVETNGTGNNSDPAEKTWIAASVKLTKVFETGPFTTPGQVCFTLSRVPAATPPPLSSDAAQQCGTGTSLTFQWDDLVAGSYTIEETTVPAGYSKIANITFTVAEDCTGVVGTCVQASASPTAFNLGTFQNDLAPGDLRVRKLLGPSGAAWNGPDVTIYVCLNGGTPPGSSSTELPLTSCDSAGEAEAVVTLTAADSSEDVTGLDEGWYTLCEFPVPAGYSVDDQCQTVQVVSGEAASANVVTFTNTPSGEGCTPGFWKTHPQLWDGQGSNDVTSTIQTTDLFNATFGVTSAQSGLEDSVTLLDATGLNGGGKKALARHAAAALASADSGIDYPYSVSQVIALYRDAVGADSGPETVQSALAKLQAANELGCPLN